MEELKENKTLEQNNFHLALEMDGERIAKLIACAMNESFRFTICTLSAEVKAVSDRPVKVSILKDNKILIETFKTIHIFDYQIHVKVFTTGLVFVTEAGTIQVTNVGNGTTVVPETQKDHIILQNLVNTANVIFGKDYEIEDVLELFSNQCQNVFNSILWEVNIPLKNHKTDVQNISIDTIAVNSIEGSIFLLIRLKGSEINGVQGFTSVLNTLIRGANHSAIIVSKALIPCLTSYLINNDPKNPLYSCAFEKTKSEINLPDPVKLPTGRSVTKLLDFNIYVTGNHLRMEGNIESGKSWFKIKRGFSLPVRFSINAIGLPEIIPSKDEFVFTNKRPLETWITHLLVTMGMILGWVITHNNVFMAGMVTTAILIIGQVLLVNKWRKVILNYADQIHKSVTDKINEMPADLQDLFKLIKPQQIILHEHDNYAKPMHESKAAISLTKRENLIGKPDTNSSKLFIAEYSGFESPVNLKWYLNNQLITDKGLLNCKGNEICYIIAKNNCQVYSISEGFFSGTLSVSAYGDGEEIITASTSINLRNDFENESSTNISIIETSRISNSLRDGKKPLDKNRPSKTPSALTQILFQHSA